MFGDETGVPQAPAMQLTSTRIDHQTALVEHIIEPMEKEAAAQEAIKNRKLAMLQEKHEIAKMYHVTQLIEEVEAMELDEVERLLSEL